MAFHSDSRDACLFILPWTLEGDGGVNQVVENLMTQMDRHGEYRPLLLVNSWNDRSVREQNIKGHHHFFLRMNDLWNPERPLGGLLAFLLFLPLTLLKLVSLISVNKITVINVHFCGLCALNISVLRMFGLFKGRFILSFHGSDLLAAQRTIWPVRPLWKILLGSADAIVTCSEHLKSEVVSFAPEISGKIACIHNCIDVESLGSAEKRLLPEGRPTRDYILNVATFEPKKGQDVLVQAFAKICGKFPDLDLVLIGRPAGSYAALKNLIKTLGLGERIRLYENVPHGEISAFFAAAMLFALSSRYEPFGIVLLEAGFFATPVVATRVGGIPEIVTHGETGMLCDPDDVDGLARELEFILGNPQERSRIGQNLRLHVLNNFTWDHAYAKYLKCLGGS